LGIVSLGQAPALSPNTTLSKKGFEWTNTLAYSENLYLKSFITLGPGLILTINLKAYPGRLLALLADYRTGACTKKFFEDIIS
jgi:hypothetical protein